MKIKKISVLQLLLCLVIISAALTTGTAKAQNSKIKVGKITGSVVDAESGQPVIGANVLVTGTTKGAATDLDGNYVISNIKPGTYDIVISYISYARKTITGVEVDSGTAIRLNAALSSKTVEGESITVTAQVNSNSVAGQLSARRKALSVKDGISSEELGKTGDSNVASAMKSITGVTIVDNNNVYVRGLGNRYSNIQLNGAEVPSTDPTKKEAPVDLVGSGLLSNIVVQKTYTPDQSAEFSGGSVQITTREFPETQNLTLAYSTALTSVSAFGNTLSYSGSGTDFLGYDNGKRSLPVAVKSERLPGNDQSLRTKFANGLSKNWISKNPQTAIPSQKISIDYADQFNEDHLPIGIVSNINYKYDRSYQPSRHILKIQSTAGKGEIIPNSDYSMNKGIEQVKLGGLLNVFMKPGRNTKIGLKNLYSNSLDNTVSRINGSYYNYESPVRQTILSFDRRSIFSSALAFETYFDQLYNSRLSVDLNYSRAYRNQPDRRTTQYNQATTNGREQYNIYFDDGGNTHYFSDQTDNNYTAKLDYEITPIDFLKLKTGGEYKIKKRDFSARRFEYKAKPYDTKYFKAYPDSLRNTNPSIALNPRLVAKGILDIQETTQTRDSYKGEQQLWATYLNTSWTPIKLLTAQVGARIESSDQEVYTGKNGDSQKPIANVEKVDILPALNLTYNISERTNLRGAYSKTLARPGFREISKFKFQDFLGGEILYGNPDLKRTSIQNYDLRLETYPNRAELFALSIFYKDFKNPIEKVYRITERAEVKYKNAKNARLYGLELEARKNLTKKLQMVANASYIYSKTTVREEEKFNVANVSRPMFGQSPYTVNLGAYYTFTKLNLDLSANYHTFGKRIVTVGKNEHPDDEYEQPFQNVSLKAKYKIRDISLTAGVQNLLNDDRVYKQGSATTFRYSPGVTYNFSIMLSL